MRPSLSAAMAARHFGHVTASSRIVHVAFDKSIARGDLKHSADMSPFSLTSDARW
jgi:hypothetical protein